MYRFISSENRYRKYKKFAKPPKGECAFCDPKYLDKIIFENDTYMIVKARFPYDLWEYCLVLDHLMIVPKTHVASIANLSAKTRQEIMNVMGEYEEQGYDVFARGKNSTKRSISDHQHTHLIKTDHKLVKAAFFIRIINSVIKF